jgi:anti-anti-sigma factor
MRDSIPLNEQHPTSMVVEGDVLSTTAESLRTRLAEVLENSAKSCAPLAIFELDLRAARMIDSVGLNLLVWLLKKVQALGGKVRLRIADSNIERTLQFTRLDQHAEIVRQHRG